jgi:2-keto-4-pentenoate hydratase/2-oxohepta-3-ene-1,7-dioic acid hydratase in catechol pathway
MRFATFVDSACVDGARFGIVRPAGMVDVIAAAQALNRFVPAVTVKAALTTGPQTLVALADLADAAERAGMVLPLDGLTLLPPVQQPSKFFCVGKNSQKHREELLANKMLAEIPNEPTGFIKLIDTMVGQDAEVVRPAGITSLDYEPELCYVVGKRCHCVSKKDALSHIAGFTLCNDLSAREIQKREAISGTRFWTAKNMPGFGPVGPYVVTLDEVPDTADLWVNCVVNGQQRLRQNTSEYLYKIAEVIEHFSRYVVFEPGDLIAMGAPSGVALGQPNADELYLRPGDQMEIAIEGVMSLRTKIIAPK